MMHYHTTPSLLGVPLSVPPDIHHVAEEAAVVSQLQLLQQPTNCRSRHITLLLPVHVIHSRTMALIIKHSTRVFRLSADRWSPCITLRLAHAHIHTHMHRHAHLCRTPKMHMLCCTHGNKHARIPPNTSFQSTVS